MEVLIVFWAIQTANEAPRCNHWFKWSSKMDHAWMYSLFLYLSKQPMWLHDNPNSQSGFKAKHMTHTQCIHGKKPMWLHDESKQPTRLQAWISYKQPMWLHDDNSKQPTRLHTWGCSLLLVGTRQSKQPLVLKKSSHSFHHHHATQAQGHVPLIISKPAGRDTVTAMQTLSKGLQMFAMLQWTDCLQASDFDGPTKGLWHRPRFATHWPVLAQWGWVRTKSPTPQQEVVIPTSKHTTTRNKHMCMCNQTAFHLLKICGWIGNLAFNKAFWWIPPVTWSVTTQTLNATRTCKHHQPWAKGNKALRMIAIVEWAQGTWSAKLPIGPPIPPGIALHIPDRCPLVLSPPEPCSSGSHWKWYAVELTK